MTRLERRRFLQAGVGATTVLWTGGCSYYRPAEGAAYEPWDFPGEPTTGRLHLVHAALLAANPHNTQPWLFRLPVDEAELQVWADFERDIGAVDPLFREMTIGLGCAVENLVIAGDVLGLSAAIEVLPDPDREDFVARVRLTPSVPQPSELYEAIGTRRTHRGAYGDFPLDPDIADAMVAIAAEFPGVRLHLLTSADQKSAFAETTVAATEAFIADEEMLADSDAWFRHTKDEIEEHRDGVTLDAQAFSDTTTFFAKSGQAVSGQRGARYWLRSTERVHTGPCSAFAILSTPVWGRAEALAVGRAYQRIALWLEHQGLACHPLSQATELRDRELQLGTQPHFGPRLAELVGDDVFPQMPFRLGYAWTSTHRSPRRPVDWITEEIAR